MAIRPWLEETVEEQLLLANHWLRDKNRKKEAGIKTEFDRKWARLYHDNGSCLDTINDIHPERNSALHVIQARPLTLTDGQCQIVAHLTTNCIRDLSKRFHGRSLPVLHAVISVRKYTIRHTSYGPPRDKLRFILQRVDWLGLDHEESRDWNIGSLPPLHKNEQVGAILEQLHNARTREDRRCLRSDVQVEEGEGATAPAMDHSNGAPMGESTPQTQMPHTQVAFGTQFVHPIRSRTSEEEPQLLGVNRMEPVLAGGTQREVIRPKASNSNYETQAKLLSLLNPVQKQGKDTSSTARPEGFIRAAFSKKQSVVELPPSKSQDQHRAIVDSQPKLIAAENENGQIATPAPTRSKERVREIKQISPVAALPTEEIPNMRQMTETEVCSWMKSFIFDREALKVPPNQQTVLSNDASWYKPQPGVRPFVDGNIPIAILQILSKIADEKAAADIYPESDSEMDIDPSPESDLEDIGPAPAPIPQVTQGDEPTTSQVSWSASPSPEPPQKAARSHLGLPPDSSFEAEGLPSNNSTAQRATVPDQQPHSPTGIDCSIDKATSAPSSSPPIAELPTDSDEEMEMETSVPQGLGEDALEPSRLQGVGTNHPSSTSPRLKPIVQVKETPYMKGKNGQVVTFANSSPKQKEDSSGNYKSASSTSIVYGTYNVPTSSGSAEDISHRHSGANNANISSGQERANALQQEEQAHEGRIRDIENTDAQDVSMTDLPSITEVSPGQIDGEDQTRIPPKVAAIRTLVTRPDPTPLSAQIPTVGLESSNVQQATLPKQSQLGSGPTKRKLGDSPSKNNKRHSKRRFGNEPPSIVDPVSVLRQERAESLRKFREEREEREERMASTSFENQPGLARNLGAQQDAVAMEIDSPNMQTSTVSLRAMSPRHRSLYEEPTPTKQPSKSISTSQSNTRAISSDVHPQAAGAIIREQAQPAAVANAPGPRTVFQTFKAAYPEYTGDVKHFQGQCTQMYQLDQEDKMVPKWQWDDFIIRNRTDYKDYILECVDCGENPEPYYRFYKDNIRDTLYKKGIIEGRGVLLKAFEELDVQPPALERLRESPRKDSSGRRSLPGAFHQHKKPAQDRINGTQRDQPRHSLPASSINNNQTPSRHPQSSNTRSPAQSAAAHGTSGARSSSKPNLLQQLSSDQLSSAPENTGDPFRDYYFAVQKTTSWTGSTKVDPSKPWPQNLAVRPSIADAPKNKADVLGWEDVL